MNKLVLGLLATALAFNVQAAKPEWAGNDQQDKQHKEQKSEKYHKKDKEREHRDYDRDDRDYDRHDRKDRDDDDRYRRHDRFSDSDRRSIRDYYSRHPASGTGEYRGEYKDLPPGLRKKLERGGDLPPGWQKKLVRGQILDPELRYYGTYLPDDLRAHLRARDAATEIIRIRDQVVRVSKGEGTIVDIIDLADILIGDGPYR